MKEIHRIEPAALPAYSAERLAALAEDQLIEHLVADQDRAPRSLIDECARRGEAMLARLERFEQDAGWESVTSLGEWWLRLHAVMLLGLIPGERAGSILVGVMRRMAKAEDEELQGWFSGYWPALFRNKPHSLEPELRRLAHERRIDWYMRIQAVESVISFGERRGAEALDAALDWAAGIAADETEDWNLRTSTANKLLDFPRARHRALLERICALQTGPTVTFSAEEVQRAFSDGKDKPHWQEHFDDPWVFYSPGRIAARQARWRKEAAEDDEEEDGLVEELALADSNIPYMRAGPKIGRNDPCPCGSGKKYKRCCLLKEEGKAR